MTQNQINYWNLQETKQHNRTSEVETERHDRATEVEQNRHNISVESETYRSNRATEDWRDRSLAETAKHNRNTEVTQSYLANETKRHNLSTEQQSQQKLNQDNFISVRSLEEQNRHNLAVEANAREQTSVSRSLAAEQATHNRATEQIDRIRNQVEAAYKQTQSNVALLTAGQKEDLTYAQVQQLNQQVSKMKSDVRLAQQSNDIRMWEAANGSINTVGNLVKQFKGGKLQ